MLKFVIIADDLTGSLDTGVQFTKKNIPTLVITDLQFELSSIPKNIEAVVIDTESRHIDGNEAKKLIKSIAEKFTNSSVKYFYKKIDSTFRGNVGKEIEGFMEGLGTRALALVPAFPDSKRIVKDGILYVNGQKITETAFAKDILNPITDDYIPDILRKNTDLDIIEYFKETSECTGNKVYLFDSTSKEDMLQIREELFNKNLLTYTAGSAGFAEILAEHLANKEAHLDIDVKTEDILFICGSVNATSLKQCKHAQEKGFPSVTLEFSHIASDNYGNNSDFSDDKNFLNEKIAKNKYLLIRTSNSDIVIEDAIKYTKENNIKMEILTENISRNTGKLIKELVTENEVQNLIVFGGDTLMGILSALECTSIIPIKEISSGVVFARVICKHQNLNIITKAGGFGEENIIEEIIKFIRKHKN